MSAILKIGRHKQYAINISTFKIHSERQGDQIDWAHRGNNMFD